MRVTSTLEAGSDWRSVSVLWSSTAAVFGWTSLSLDEERPSASQSHPEPGSAEQASSQTSETGAQRTVLLVEDNETDVFVIREVLKRSGLNYQLRVARDGQDALRFLDEMAKDEKSPGPALVLLDLNIPKVPGLEVLRRLRSRPQFNRTPVVVVSSSDSESDRDTARRLGAEVYFRKPQDLAAYMDLAGVIRRVLPAEGES
jgi:CheY-like chemotaxis protein